MTLGENQITASAVDRAGNTAEDIITVNIVKASGIFTELQYDGNGNLVSRDDRGKVTTYEYDRENRLTRAALPDGTTNEFSYDGDKRRTSRKTADGTVTGFLYDGLNILEDLNENGAIKAGYLQGPGIDRLIAVTEWESQTSGPRVGYYHCDALGSVRLLTDEAGEEVKRYAYDAWGKVTSETGASSTSGNEYKFTSRRWEDELGLQYNRARFYDPELGRFITRDPLTGGPDDPSISYFSGVYSQIHRFIKEYVDALQPDKLNRYVYCYNNPVNLIDPLGLSADEDATAEVKVEADKAEIGQREEEKAGQLQTTGTETGGQTASDVEENEIGFNWAPPEPHRLRDRREARKQKELEDEWKNMWSHEKRLLIKHNYREALKSINRKIAKNSGKPVHLTPGELLSIMMEDALAAKRTGYDKMGLWEFQMALKVADGTFFREGNYRGQQFTIKEQFGSVPPGTYKGSDINYYYQGFASVARGPTGYGNAIRIVGWNIKDAVGQDSFKEAYNQLDQISKGSAFAKTGREIYKQHQKVLP